MMTITDFNLLDDQGKGNILWEGVFLGDRFDGRQHVQLYSVHLFYVEVFYDAGRNGITGFHAFSEIKYLDPYLWRLRY